MCGVSQLDDCNSESIDMNANSDTDDTLDFMWKRQLCKEKKIFLALTFLSLYSLI